MEIGDAVGAIAFAREDTVYFLGYGTYEGKEVPPEEIRGFNLGLPNPKLKLADGSIIWGCECWWGAEAKIKAMLEGYSQVTELSVEEFRSNR